MQKQIVNSSLIKMGKTLKTKIEVAKCVASMTICFNQDKKVGDIPFRLSDTELTVLAYFMVYGITAQTKNLIVKSGVCKTVNNIKIIMVKLKKLGLIYKDDFDGRVRVTKALSFEITPVVGIYFKISNT